MKVFGIQFGKAEQNDSAVVRSPVKPSGDGALEINTMQGLGSAAGAYTTTLNLDGQIQNDNELIRRYRDLSLNPEVDDAITNITSEAIVIEEDKDPIEVDLQRLESMSESTKKKITEEFQSIMKMLNFKTEGTKIFRRWYIDGRIHYHMLIDEKNLKEGIKEFRYIDPRKIKKVREFVRDNNHKMNDDFMVLNNKIKEYWIFSDSQIDTEGSSYASQAHFNKINALKIARDSIAYSDSGLLDPTGKMIIGYLHKAIRPANMLRMLEDSVLIYNITRAQERRVFYIDVGNLPRAPAEQYVKEIMNKFKTNLIFNAETGEIRDDRRHVAMTEDFWLPRRDGSRGTEVGTIPAGQSLSQQIESLDYFKKKLLKSMGIPLGRMEPENQVSFSKTATEISREEMKFSRFIENLRSNFNGMFECALKLQLILKGIVDNDEWEEIRGEIGFKYNSDNFFSEIKENEILGLRLDMFERLIPYKDDYFTEEYIFKSILKYSDDQIKEVEKSREEKKKRQEEELKAGLPPEDGTGGFPEPEAPVPTPPAAPVTESELDTVVASYIKKYIPES